MAKTLSESAAEILQASIATKQEEPQQVVNAGVQDLGGATTENPGGEGVGSAAAAGVAEAPKPGQTSTEGDKEGNPTTQGLAQPVVAPIGTNLQGEETSVQDVTQEKKNWIREKVNARKGSMVEDVNALFNGESLSEDFRTKATVIFEAAVQSRVESIVEDVLSDNDKIIDEAIEGITSELSEQVDSYLNYVVEEWMKENQVAIERGLRAEISEDLLVSLKNVFAEHYIEIPDSKVDVAEELASQVIEMQDTIAAREEELVKVTEEFHTAKKNESIRKICEGLTEVQVGKMKSLAEGVEFTTEGDYINKLTTIRENYFPSKTTVKSEVKAIQETTIEQPEVEAEISGIMAHYVSAITKTNPKF